MSEELEKVVDATQTDVVDQGTEGNRVKADKADEVATSPDVKEETPKEQPKVQTKEENAQFAEVRRKEAKKAEDALVKKLAKSFGWENIETREQLDAALEEQEIKKEAEEKGVDESYVKKLKKLEKENAEYKTKQQREEQYKKFFKEYPDVSIKEVPQEVWNEFTAGKDLTDSYARYENKTLKEKLAKYELQNKAEELNQSNSQASTGSVKSTLPQESGLITQEQFDANKSNKEWVNKNLDKLIKSRNKGLITH